ncbi:MAG: helix-turn-helix domain-containing protein [Candidatus Competibacteraceae bacterium]
MTELLENAIEYWKYVAPVAKRPETEQDYDALVAHLDALLDIVGNDERHPLVGLVDIISDHVSDYEIEHYEKLPGSGIDALKFLMDAHQLTQSDFKEEIGSQGVVSEILNGYRKLNLNHIKKLSQRFKVSPETFID